MGPDLASTSPLHWGFNPSFLAFRYFPPSIILHIASYLPRPLVYTSNNPSIASIGHISPLSLISFLGTHQTMPFIIILWKESLLWSVFPPQSASITSLSPGILQVRYYRDIQERDIQDSRNDTAGGGEFPPMMEVLRRWLPWGRSRGRGWYRLRRCGHKLGVTLGFQGEAGGTMLYGGRGYP